MEIKHVTIRVLIADEQELVCEGINHLLSREPGITVVGKECGDANVLQHMLDLQPDVAIIDFHMGAGGGCEIARNAFERGFTGKIIILCQVDDEDYGRQAIHAGATGFVLKNCKREDLITAIRDVAGGATYVSTEFSKALLRSFLRRASEIEEHGQLHRLTDRELQILKYVAEGRTSKNIADIIFVSKRTVDFHRRNIMGKLKIHDLPTLVRFAIQTGLVENMTLDGPTDHLPAPAKTEGHLPDR